jgi:RNA polymerase-binding protein DksA
MTNEKKTGAGKTSGKANGKAVGSKAAGSKAASGKTAAKTVSKTPVAGKTGGNGKAGGKAGASVKTLAKTAAKTVSKTPGKAAGSKAATGKAAAAKTAVGKTAAGKTAAAKTAGKTPIVIKTTARKITSGNAAKTVKKEKYSEPAEPKNGWQAFTDEMERSLLAKKSEIIDNLVAGSNDFKEIVEGMDPKDLADIASDDIDRKMIETLGAQELKHLKLIDSALTRIKQGKYGFCIKCDRRIPPDRLEVIPEALMCIECKTAEERRSR